MCLILLSYDAHPDYRLILAANRDEFFARPTAQASFWGEAPQLLAGRDLKGGGTWLGITKNGRIAAITNYRDPRSYREGAPSRGRLVSDFLLGTMTAADYLELLKEEGGACNGFNLIFGDTERLCYFSNRDGFPSTLGRGIHGLSNHLLDTPWPKVARGKEALERLATEGKDPSPEALFAILADRTSPPDHLLPDTGVGLERERQLSPLFISTPDYGTRSSTLVLIDRECRVTFMERTFNGGTEPSKTVTYRFSVSF
ncbi:MAG: hypothetical protein FD174_3166 [Geobacteraceae bacterium]|nr:MAG: hypothetical protein FD174_3166 [Geobacteraceae bacterium]